MAPVKHEYSFSGQFDKLQELKQNLKQNTIADDSQLEAIKTIESDWINDEFRKLLLALSYTFILEEQGTSQFKQDQQKKLTTFTESFAEKVKADQLESITKEVTTWIDQASEKAKTDKSILTTWLTFIDNVIKSHASFKEHTNSLNQWITHPETHTDTNITTTLLDNISHQWRNTAQQLAPFNPTRYTLEIDTANRPVTPSHPRQNLSISSEEAFDLSDLGDLKSPPQAPRKPKPPNRAGGMRVSFGSPEQPNRNRFSLDNRLLNSIEEELKIKNDALEEQIKTLYSDLDIKERNLNRINDDLHNARVQLDLYEGQLAEKQEYEQEIETLKSRLTQATRKQRQSEVGFDQNDTTLRETIIALEENLKEQKKKVSGLHEIIKNLEESLKHSREAGNETRRQSLTLQQGNFELLKKLNQLTGNAFNEDNTDDINKVIDALHRQHQTSTNTIKALKQHYQDASDKIVELEQQERDLKKAHQEAIEEFTGITTAGLEVAGYDARIVELTQEKHTLKAQLSELNDQLHNVQKGQTKLEAEYSQLTDEYNQQKDEIQRLTDEIEAKTGAMAPAQQNDAETDQEQIAELALEIEQLTEERDQLQADLNEKEKEFQDAYTKLEIHMEAIADAVEDNEEEKKATQAKYETLQLEYDSITQQLDSANQTIATLKHNASESQLKPANKVPDHLNPKWVHAQSEKLKGFVAEFLTQVELTKLNLANQQTQALKTQAASYQTTIDALSEDLNTISQQLDAQTDDMAKFENQYDHAQTELLQLESAVQHTKGELATLQSEKADMNAFIGQLQSEIEQLSEKVQSCDHQGQDETALVEAQHTIAQLQSELKTAQDKLNDVETQYQKTHTTYQKKLDAHQSQNDNTHDLATQLKTCQHQFFKLWIILQKKTKAHQAEIDHWMNTTGQLESHFKEINDNHRQQLDNLMTHNDALVTQLNESSTSTIPNDDIVAQVQSLKTQLAEEKAELDDCNETIARLNATIANLTQQLENQEAHNKLDTDPLSRTSTAQSSGVFSQPFSKSTTHATPVGDEYDSNPLLEKEIHIQQLEQEIRNLKAEIGHLNHGRRSTIHFDNQEEQIEQLENDRGKLKIELLTLQSTLTDKDTEATEHQQTIWERDEQIKMLNAAINELKEDIEDIGEQFDTQVAIKVDEKVEAATQKYAEELQQAQEALDELHQQLAERDRQHAHSPGPDLKKQFLPDMEATKAKLAQLEAAISQAQTTSNIKETTESLSHQWKSQVDVLTGQVNQLTQLVQSQAFNQKPIESDSVWLKLEPMLAALKIEITSLKEAIHTQTTQAAQSQTQLLQERVRQLEVEQKEKPPIVTTHDHPVVTRTDLHHAISEIANALRTSRESGPRNYTENPFISGPYTPDTPPATANAEEQPKGSIFEHMSGYGSTPLVQATLHQAPPNLDTHPAQDKMANPLATTEFGPQPDSFENLERMARWIDAHRSQLTYAFAQHGHELLKERFKQLIQQRHDTHNEVIIKTCQTLLFKTLKNALQVKRRSSTHPIVSSYDNQGQSYAPYDLFRSTTDASPLSLTDRSTLYRETSGATDLKLQLYSSGAEQDAQHALLNFAQMIIAHAEVYPNLTLTINDNTEHAHELIAYLQAYQGLYATVLGKTLNFRIENADNMLSIETIRQKQAIILGTPECDLFTQAIATGVNTLNPAARHSFEQSIHSPSLSPIICGA